MVFRTNVCEPHEALLVLKTLRSFLHRREKATIDLEDCDKVLRIETRNSTKAEIIALMDRAGYYCAELEDTVSPR